MKRFAISTVFVTALLLASQPADAEECGLADQLVIQATQSKAATETLLLQAVAECPKHLAALNNLALILESQERLDEAEQLYRRAIVVDATVLVDSA